MKVGILGAGHIGGKLARTIAQMDGVDNFAVASRDLAKAEAFAREFGVQKAYGSYEEMVSDPDVDLVYVATPHSHHFGHARLALEHGKAVLCEKAFTANAREARDLVSLARQKKLFLAEAIWTRYMPFSQTISEIISSGVIGTPRMLNASLSYQIEHKERILRPELCGGALLDLGVYCINFARMCFGTDIMSISSSCFKGPSGVDMQECISMLYEDGRVATLTTSATCCGDRRGKIFGDKGFIVVNNCNNPTEASVYGPHEELIATYTAPSCINGYEYEIQACKDALERGLTETPFMPLDETVAIMEMMDKLRQDWGVIYPMD